MVNGTTSRILYVGAYGMIAMVLAGIVLLSSTNHPIPIELDAALTTLLGFIAGAHVKPPIGARQDGNDNEK